MPENRGININTSGDITSKNDPDINHQKETVNLEKISDNVSNTINELPASPVPDQQGIKELLVRLQKMIEGDENLKPENKVEALEQVGILAKVGKNPQIEENQRTAESAIRMLRGIKEEVPKATNFTEACQNILPQLSTIFGLG